MGARPPGRPRIELDEEQVLKCAEKLWKIEEIAAFFRCSRDTIERRFAAKIEEARHRGRAKIWDMALKRASEGSDKMIIYCNERVNGPSHGQLNLGDTMNIQVNQFAKLPPEKLTEQLDALMEEQKVLTGEKD